MTFVSESSPARHASWAAAVAVIVFFSVSVFAAFFLTGRLRDHTSRTAILQIELARTTAAWKSIQPQLESRLVRAKASSGGLQAQLLEARAREAGLQSELDRIASESVELQPQADEAVATVAALQTQVDLARAAMIPVQKQIDSLTERVTHMEAQMNQYAAESGHAANANDFGYLDDERFKGVAGHNRQ